MGNYSEWRTHLGVFPEMEYDLQTGACDVDVVLEGVVMFQRPWPEVKIIVKTANTNPCMTSWENFLLHLHYVKCIAA